jgi:hypothetical protein
VATPTLALSKGRIYEEPLRLIEATGTVLAEDPDSSRKLIIDTMRRRWRAFPSSCTVEFWCSDCFHTRCVSAIAATIAIGSITAAISVA